MISAIRVCALPFHANVFNTELQHAGAVELNKSQTVLLFLSSTPKDNLRSRVKCLNVLDVLWHWIRALAHLLQCLPVGLMCTGRSLQELLLKAMDVLAGMGGACSNILGYPDTQRQGEGRNPLRLVVQYCTERERHPSMPCSNLFMP